MVLPITISQAKTPALLWSEPMDEGQLSVDVLETPDAFFLQSPIAGVDPSVLNIFLNHDTVTIQGERSQTFENNENVSQATFHFQECYWGKFSRTVLFPSPIRVDAARAVWKNGVLTLCLPKAIGEARLAVECADGAQP